MISIEELKKLYENDKRANNKSLDEFNEAKKYYHGDQLPESAKAIIKARGQSVITENIFKLIVNKIVGYKAQSISEIKVNGRQESDKNTANIINDILKLFSQNRNYNKEIIARDKDLIFGLAVVELWINETKKGNYEIEIKNLSPQTLNLNLI